MPALGSSVDLDSVGDRLMNAVFRDDRLWTAHCIAYGDRTAARWYEIDTDSMDPRSVRYGVTLYAVLLLPDHRSELPRGT